MAFQWWDIPLALGTAGMSIMPRLAMEGANAAKKYIPGAVSNTLGAAQNYTNSAVQAQQQFNADQAQIQRDWEERMSNTAVQRQVADIKAAGLNPWLALNGGSVNGASTPSGASASSNSAFAEVYGMTSMMNTLVKAVSTIANTASSFAGAAAKIAASS